MKPDDPAGTALSQILAAIEEIAKVAADGDPKGALDCATRWAGIIGTDRRRLLAMVERRGREGRKATEAFIADEADSDLLEIGRLMKKWGLERVEQRDGLAVSTQPKVRATVKERVTDE